MSARTKETYHHSKSQSLKSGQQSQVSIVPELPAKTIKTIKSVRPPTIRRSSTATPTGTLSKSSSRNHSKIISQNQTSRLHTHTTTPSSSFPPLDISEEKGGKKAVPKKLNVGESGANVEKKTTTHNSFTGSVTTFDSKKQNLKCYFLAL